MSQFESRRSTAAERVLGGSPGGVLVRLVVMSLVVGLVLRVLNVNVNDVVNWFDQRLRDLSMLGINSIAELGQIVVVGAVIVVPIWLLLRVMKILSR